MRFDTSGGVGLGLVVGMVAVVWIVAMCYAMISLTA
jgi:hypothetical protein